MSGDNEHKARTFDNLYDRQIENQNLIIKKGSYNDISPVIIGEEKKLPFDDPRLASYHIQQLISEIGEVLDADKRWKSFRNGKFDKDGKLEEIADCFIVAMNIAIFSGFSSEDVSKAISEKLDVVKERINNI